MIMSIIAMGTAHFESLLCKMSINLGEIMKYYDLKAISGII